MYFPQPEAISGVARQTTRAETFAHRAELLRNQEIPVPEIYLTDDERGVVVVEDLGDETLAARLLAAPQQTELLYRQAVLLLSHAQARLETLSPAELDHRCFDRELLSWEMDHFLDFALEARGAKVTHDERASFQPVRDWLVATLLGMPQTFLHRDYQSKNLMVRGAAEPTLTWIDFQDAMTGPRTYDLVALLTDSYQSFPRAFVESRLREFSNQRGVPADDIFEEFDLVTVQRKLKDAGRFVYLAQVRELPAFLPFIEPALLAVRAALERLGHHDALRPLHPLLARALQL
jgi:N-acetylmuramate 1-kinase